MYVLSNLVGHAVDVALVSGDGEPDLCVCVCVCVCLCLCVCVCVCLCVGGDGEPDLAAPCHYMFSYTCYKAHQILNETEKMKAGIKYRK
jgi:hypothetical protein